MISEHGERTAMTSASVVTAIDQSQRAMRKLLATCLGHHGLNIAEWLLLSCLYESTRTPTDIAKALGFKPPYVALILRGLANKENLITESAKHHDTRSKTLELSLEGRVFVSDIEAKLQVCIERELTQKVSPNDLQTYFTVSDFIAVNVKHHG